MVLNDKVYGVLKWACLIAVPALVTFLATLGTIYGVDMTKATATIGAVATLIGALIGVSNAAYKKDDSEGVG